MGEWERRYSSWAWSQGGTEGDGDTSLIAINAIATTTATTTTTEQKKLQRRQQHQLSACLRDEGLLSHTTSQASQTNVGPLAKLHFPTSTLLLEYETCN